MFEGSRPIFKSDMVLKAKDLTLGCQFSEDIFYGVYHDYSDGILEGASVRIADRNLVVAPGVLKYQGAFYTMREEETVPLKADGKWHYLVIRFREKRFINDQIERKSIFYMSEESERQIDELELARFRLNEGAVLRQDYQGFWDLDTEYNTLNIIYADYAGRKEKTLSKEITTYFGKEILAVSKDVADIYFGMECAKGNVVNRSAIVSYLSRRLGEAQIEKMDNLALYHALKRVWIKVKGSEEGKKGAHPAHRILVN